MENIAKYNWMIRIVVLSVIIVNISATFTWSAEPDHFSLYRFPADGFEVEFPQKPLEFRTDKDLEYGYSNSYQALVVNPISQHSVFVGHSPKRVFEDDSIDAYLEGMVSGLIKGADEPALEYTRKIRFLGFPAIEYKYTHKIEGVPVIGRGIVLIVDGEHIRLSQLYVINDGNAEKNFKRFVDSFRLTPIDSVLSKKRFHDVTRDISFSPPEGWKRGTSKFAQVLTTFTNPGGHSITVLDSGTPAYMCGNYKAELQATQVTQDAGKILASRRTVVWLKSTAYNPAAKIKMTSVHYCVNTMKGAVVMIGAAPEQTFFRSEIIFRNTAASMVLRN
ncbi:MAG: hypothetical protein KAT46_05815 [Deltaproteobacteria bacterium]|nr:hypothetical protein [Deltaproteobacteria bacterium]